MMSQYARNPMVKNYLYRLAERQKPIDTDKWYYLHAEAFPENIREKFLQSSFDAGTEAFLENCYEKSDWIFTQVYHNIMRTILGWFMSMTTVNGFLSRGSMFVFSEKQFHDLLEINNTWKADALLDLGAGDGRVTEPILHHFESCYATEQSKTMQWRLQEKGFQVLEIDKWQQPNKYSVITALNLMDRIDTPIKLLHQMRSAVKEDGVVVLAIVLPYNPCYETGTSFRPPQEVLPICGKSIEQQIQSLHDKIFPDAGFEVVKFTRVPYLCEGDLHIDFFALDDIVFVLRPSKITELKEDGACVVSHSI